MSNKPYSPSGRASLSTVHLASAFTSRLSTPLPPTPRAAATSTASAHQRGAYQVAPPSSLVLQTLPKGDYKIIPSTPDLLFYNHYGGFNFSADRLAFIAGDNDVWNNACYHLDNASARYSTDLHQKYLIASAGHRWNSPGSLDVEAEPQFIRAAHFWEIRTVKNDPSVPAGDVFQENMPNIYITTSLIPTPDDIQIKDDSCSHSAMPGQDIRLLALDGGGVRGLSSLIILKQLMETINPDSPPKPCDFFHMIWGTSTGGLVVSYIMSML
ncbi:MAG: hypothetical protein L6R40_001555 [Gallowayella cf. fulva]|nr:MAG: hypothetical protein L6R40_001555 [Xanthomendoza cf. fulva]